MAAPTAEKVRNVVLVGQDGSGKTSLAEAMLHLTGQTSRMGTTHDGKSNLDYDAEEKKRKFTIATSIAPVQYKGYKINVLDTSGFPDFLGDTVASMQAAEMAMFVIDAGTGPQVMHSKLWHTAENMRICRSIFINHIDQKEAKFEDSLAALQEAFGDRVGAVNIPIGQGEDFKGVIDILRMKARYNAEGGKERVEDIPAEYMDQAEEARDHLCELVAEADDDLMMKYLDGEERLTQDELEMLLGKAIAQRIFVPIFVGSTIIEQGVNAIMDDIISYFPAPDAHGPFLMANGDEIVVDENDRPGGFIFKTISDPFVGRLSFMKVFAGTIEPGMELICNRTGKKERIAHLYLMTGSKTEDVKSAKAGDIIVIPKLGDVRTSDTLSETGKIAAVVLPLPTPNYPVVIRADKKDDDDKVGDFLAKSVEADPTMTLTRNEETHQTILTCLGEAQSDVLISRLKERFGIDAHYEDIRIPYRETIRKTASAQGRHKKQTGGSGQFGDCWLRLEPNPGMGYEFVDEIVGGKIPRNYIPAVDKGVQETMAEGVLAGYPMVDVKVAVYDGSYHSVDSSEIAFKTAARIGFRAACEKADMVLLEPMADLTIVVPEAYVGAILGDIPTKRGLPMGMDMTSAGTAVIKGRFPYAEVVHYGRDLRSLSRGSGEYTIQLNGYQQVPGDVAKKLVEEYHASKEK